MPSQVASLPSPTGGWNTRDPFDRMPPEDAVQLDNFFPDTGYVQLRRGHVVHCDTVNVGRVDTLFSYAGGADSMLLAAVGGDIVDVTTSTPSVLATGYSSDVWNYTAHSAGGTPRLIAANNSGLDVPFVFDGTTVAPVVVTGVTDTDLSQVLLYAQRMWYVERDTLSLWYTTSGAFQGALTLFDAGPFCKKGGAINAIGSWTRDNGTGGADDLFVVVTTEGEVLLYSGTDPASATDWVLNGVFAVGKPIPGPRCLVKTGPDLVLICADGFQPLSEYLLYGSTRAIDTGLARKIANAAQAAVATYRNFQGWQGVIYGEASMLLVNIPQSDAVYYQYVANTTTGAWCRFMGMDARCWAVLGGNLYFGQAGGIVCQALSGLTDNGVNIVGTVVTSYQYVGGRGAQKRFIMCRPVLQTQGEVLYSLGVSVDYSLDVSLSDISASVPTEAVWDTSLWDVGLWGGGTISVQKNWSGVSGIGYSVAVQIRAAAPITLMQINSFDLMYERGWAI